MYGDELYEVTPQENSIRNMLYLNWLPTNQVLRDKMNQNIDGLCEYDECYNDGIDETLHHIVYDCPQYEEIRKIWWNEMLLCVEISNEKVNNNNESDKTPKYLRGKKIIKVIKDKNNENYYSQFIVPPTQITQVERIRMLKATINFIRKTNRFHFKN